MPHTTHNNTHLQDIRKDVLLHHRVVHPDRPATNLDPIADEVVVLPADLLDLPRIQLRDVLVHRRGERVVRAAPPPVREKVLVCVRAREERELRHPEELRGVGEHERAGVLCRVRECEAQAAERGPPALRAAGAREQEDGVAIDQFEEGVELGRVEGRGGA